ncbi:MAG TPA: HIT domain-containing protein [Acidimicrobiales bacterium]|nr:HIT domain-containing protein [Acidimicrobiales bacterium]
MTLQRLWAGWRNDYVSGVATVDPGECVFCALFDSGASDREALVVWRGEHTIVMLNLYPYASGHLLVMPVRHVADLAELTALESSALWAGAVASVAAVKQAYSPDGVNLGANLGRAAGAGVPGHLHLHAVPRWVGDTNFMTAVGEVRVMPEDLATSYDKVRAAWQPPGEAP